MSRRDVMHVAVDWLVPALLILLVPILFTFYVLNEQSKHRLERAQISSCIRGNVVRSRLNEESIKEHELYADAADVLAQYGDGVAMAKLERVLRLASADEQKIPLPDCAKEVHDP